MIKNGQRFFEISAVIMTGVCKFVFVDMLPFKSWYIVTTCLFWIIYVFLRYQKHKDILKYWGFSKSGFRDTFRTLLPLAVLSIVGFVIYGMRQDVLVFNWHIIPTLLLYPLWGIVQQFLIVSLIAGNLKDLQGIRVPFLLFCYSLRLCSQSCITHQCY